jgi:sodium/hydrogen exchanger 8
MSDGSSNTDDDHENDQTIPVFFLFFMLLFALVLLLGRALHNRPRLNSYLSEPAMVLLVSLFVSFLVKVFLDGDEEGEQQVVYDGYYAYNDDDGNDDEQSIYVDQNKLSKFLTTFSEEVFFMVFLPPIMFNSGYELKRELFFRHLKPILSFAVVGTAFSGTMTGMILWGITSLGWTGDAQLNMWELLTFGALITATDTVSVLGVLNAKQVNPHLFSLVFGESAFNDAVAIVLFQTFSHLVRLGGIRGQVVDEATHFTIEFLWDVLGCPLLGLSISCAAALLFKIFDFGGTPVLELSLYLLIIYIPFITAEVLGMSGIITIFMTGMFARRYIEPNVSDETKHNAEVIFSLVAYMAETCIFLNLGLSVFGFEGDYHWSFIGFALMSSLIGRAMSIYPISFIYNWYLTEPVEGPPEPLHYRRKTVDEVSSKDIEDDITLAISSMKTSESADEASHNTPDIEFPTNDKGDLAFSPGGTARSPGGTVRRTPAKKLDKVIPVKFMHFLWFAGLRGAVAYAWYVEQVYFACLGHGNAKIFRFRADLVFFFY